MSNCTNIFPKIKIYFKYLLKKINKVLFLSSWGEVKNTAYVTDIIVMIVNA